jgi:DNA helicase-2/ATP-dependent DNA helicase PcrA
MGRACDSRLATERSDTLLLERLNEEQRRAVEHVEGPLLILAGAGSGKTRVITHRIAWLICEKDVPPDAIVAMTFTNKAADEMQERVADLLDRAEAAGDLKPEQAARKTTISTFHSLGARMLRRHGGRLGLDWNMTILDADDQLELVKEVSERHGFDMDHSEAKQVQRYIERMKNLGLTPTQAQERTSDQSEEEDADFYGHYQQEMRSANCADFGEMLLGVLELFREDAELAEDYSYLWRFVTVDEFQDTNPAQYELLEHLTTGHDNLAVVGDDDQAIYRWRDATVDNILGFEDDFDGTKVVKLERNYRSTERILNAANDIIKHNPHRRPKKLWTQRQGGEPLTVFTGRSEREEAEYVAEQIDRLVRGSGDRRERTGELNWSDTAVFYRVNALSRQLEEQLRNYGIPYQVIGGTSFYERAEIKDVLAYLRLALNPQNDVSCLRIIGTPPRGVGDVTVEKLRRATDVPGIDSIVDAARYAAGMTDGVGVEMGAVEAEPHDPGDYEALEALDNLGGRPTGGLTDFCELIVDLRDGLVETEGLAELAQMLVDRINYLEYLKDKSDDDGPDRVDNVRELIGAMSQFEEAGGSPLEELAAPGDADEGSAGTQSMLADDGVGSLLREFLERSSLVRETDEPEGESVTLMTIHGAKGLEFDTVFVVGVEDKLFPNQRQGERLADEKLQEERRLSYVAVTRAETKLFLTNAKRRQLYGKTRRTRPSRFLLDIDEERLMVDPMSSVDDIDYGPSRGHRSWGNSGQGRGNSWSNHSDRQSSPAGANRGDSSEEHYYRDDVYESAVDDASEAETDYFSQVQPSESTTSEDRDASFISSESDSPSEDGSLVGATVMHARYGIGRVESVTGEGEQASLEIYFPEESNRKTIKRSYVELVG